MNELIRSGGFQGGISTGARSPILDDRKARLAQALDRLSSSVEQAGAERVIRQTEVLREDAQKNAQTIIAERMRGYTAEQMGELLSSDEMAQEFADNPYLLPSLQKHRGRTIATESVQRMVSEGVEPTDREAVQAWLRESVPQFGDPFSAAGFNEEFTRQEAQLQQMQFQRVLEDSRQEARDAFGSEIELILGEGGMTSEQRMERIWEASQLLGLRGGEVSDALLNRVRRAAAEGDVETAQLLASTPRPGGIPALLNDTRLAGSAASYVAMAERSAEAAQSEQRIIALDTLMDRMILGGATMASVERSPEWETLGERERSQLRGAWRREQGRRQDEARRTNAASFSAQARAEALMGYIDSAIAGEAAWFDDVSFTNPFTGRQETVRGSELREDFRTMFRQQQFPGGVLNPEAADQGAYRRYARGLAVNGISADPAMTGFFNSTATLMGAEGIDDAHSERVLRAFSIYQQLPENLRGEYVRDSRMEAVFSALRDEMEAFPQNDPAQALRTAHSVATSQVPYESREINRALDGLNLRIPDHDNPSRFLWFTTGPGQVEARVQAEREASIELRRTLSQGLSLDRATERAEAHVARNWIAVNGTPVRLPPARTGDRDVNPESWRADVTDALHALAREDGLDDTSGYRIVHRVDQVYTLTRPAGVEGREQSEDIPAFAIQALAQSYRQARDYSEQQEQAAQGLQRRERRREGQRAATRAGLSGLPLTSFEIDEMTNQ